jgi:hypothetical protein
MLYEVVVLLFSGVPLGFPFPLGFPLLGLGVFGLVVPKCLFVGKYGGVVVGRNFGGSFVSGGPRRRRVLILIM